MAYVLSEARVEYIEHTPDHQPSLVTPRVTGALSGKVSPVQYTPTWTDPFQMGSMARPLAGAWQARLGKLSGAHCSGTAAHPLRPALTRALRDPSTSYYRHVRTPVRIITTREDMRDPSRRKSGRLVPLASSGVPHSRAPLEILEIPAPD